MKIVGVHLKFAGCILISIFSRMCMMTRHEIRLKYCGQQQQELQKDYGSE